MTKHFKDEHILVSLKALVILIDKVQFTTANQKLTKYKITKKSQITEINNKDGLIQNLEISGSSLETNGTD